MRSTRALWITSDYPSPADPVAGVFFRTQARALKRTGVDVEVVAPVPFAPAALARLSEQWDRYHRAPREYSDEGVKVHRPRYLAMPRQNEIGIPHLFLERAVRRVVKGELPDVVHGHYAYPEGVAALGVARSLRRPLVLTLHGDDAATYPDQGRTASRRFEKAVKGADRVVAVSDALADVTERRTGVRPTVLHLGLDLRGFDGLPSRAQARAELGVPPQEFMILFVGYLREPKGIRELTAAMAAPGLEGAVLHVIGDGPLRSELEGSSRIRPVGVVPNERVKHYMRAADVLVLPSHAEGTPTVVVEAGAAGLPVVATSVGGTTALLAEGRGLLVPPGQVGPLSRALIEVRSQPKAAHARAERLKAHVFDDHDADGCAKRLGELYSSLRADLQPVGIPAPKVVG